MTKTKTVYPASLLCDFYKVSHKAQYPAGTETVYSTWTPRETRIPGVTEVVNFGLQGFILKYLVEYFNEHFFDRQICEVIEEYERVLKYTLGIENPDSEHIADLWTLGYLPLEIKALPEGTRVPIRVPMATVENTDPRYFWLTNYIETIWSAEIWQSCTSATISAEYRRILDGWATKTTGSTAGVEYQAHDFSIRGLTSLDTAAKSGAAHLLSFVGTDNIPGICYLENYYGANIEKEMVGTSIPATEHSVMCAYGQDELSSYRRIITEIYPTGLVSVVSDTWDLWKVMTEVLPALKEDIMARDGKLVIRPDSGDPADIICGTSSNPNRVHTREVKDPKRSPDYFGVVELLWDEFGGTINDQGYKVLDSHVGAIYGDSITPERANDICARLERKGFASTNIVFGVGSYTFQYQTRDTFGFAMKSTWVKVNGEGVAIFKDPATDVNKVKKSLKGRVVVVEDAGKLVAIDGLTEETEKDYDSLLETVLLNGLVTRFETLADIRSRLTNP
jgi:nicotinamide phosphoribosyltransferase